MSAGDNMRPVADRMLKVARAVAAQHEPTSAELKLARHLAQQGASWAEMHEALGWDCTALCTRKRLLKFNIFSRRRSHGVGAKFGGQTTIPADARGSAIDVRSYKPERRA